MGYTEKIDVLDMIINVLHEHEKELDCLINRLTEVLAKHEKYPSYHFGEKDK